MVGKDDEALEHCLVDLALLVPHPRNYKKHPPKQIAKIKASLARFGQRKDIVVQPGPVKSLIVAGHGTVIAAQELEWKQLSAAIIPQDWPEDAVLGYMVADNETSNDAEDDETALAELLQEQKDAGFSLESLGWDEDEFQDFLKELGDEALTGNNDETLDASEDDEIDPDSIEIRCKRGELWRLGKHYLLVDDCTKPENVTRLLQGKKIDLVVTSPPYSDQREYGLGSFNWHSLMCGSFEQMIANAATDCHILINLGLSHKDRKVDMYWQKWLEHCSNLKWPLFAWYVWDQGSGLPGEWGGRLAPSHEFVFHFNQKRKYPNKWIETLEESQKPRIHKKALRNPDNSVDTVNSPDKFGQLYKIPDSVIRVNREAARGIHTQNHPAVFPVAFPEFIMKTWSQEGDSIYEPFCGSGTTMIAAERLERCCYACEIDEKYASVVLARWEAETGLEPELLQEAR